MTSLAQRAHDEYGDEDRSDCLQGADEQITEDSDESCLGQCYGENGADDDSDCNPKDQTGFGVFFRDGFECIHEVVNPL